MNALVILTSVQVLLVYSASLSVYASYVLKCALEQLLYCDMMQLCLPASFPGMQALIHLIASNKKLDESYTPEENMLSI